MGRAKAKQPVRFAVDLDEQGEWCHVAILADGTSRPATAAEQAAIEDQARRTIRQSAECFDEATQRAINDPDWRPRLSPRYYQYVTWKSGRDPGYRPTLADLWLLAVEEQRETYAAPPAATPPAAKPPEELPGGDDSLLCPQEVAKRFGVSLDAARSKLRRFRDERLDGWHEVTEPKPRQPRYLYRLSAVRSLFADRATSE